MTTEEKELLEEYTNFLLQEGYVDADIYAEPPSQGVTVIDLFILKKTSEAYKEKK